MTLEERVEILERELARMKEEATPAPSYFDYWRAVPGTTWNGRGCLMCGDITGHGGLQCPSIIPMCEARA